MITERTELLSLYIWNDNFETSLSGFDHIIDYLYGWTLDHKLIEEDYLRYFPFWSVNHESFVVQDRKEYVLLLIRVNVAYICRCLEYSKFDKHGHVKEVKQEENESLKGNNTTKTCDMDDLSVTARRNSKSKKNNPSMLSATSTNEGSDDDNDNDDVTILSEEDIDNDINRQLLIQAIESLSTTNKSTDDRGDPSHQIDSTGGKRAEDCINAWEDISDSGKTLMVIVSSFWKRCSIKSRKSYLEISYRLMKLNNFRNHHFAACKHANRISMDYLPEKWKKYTVPQKRCALDERSCQTTTFKCKFGVDVITATIRYQHLLFKPIVEREPSIHSICSEECFNVLLDDKLAIDLDDMYKMVSLSDEKLLALRKIKPEKFKLYRDFRKDVGRVMSHHKSIALLRVLNMSTLKDSSKSCDELPNIALIFDTYALTTNLFGSDYSLLVVILYIILSCDEKMRTVEAFFPVSLISSEKIIKYFGTSTSKYGAFPSFIDKENEEEEEHACSPEDVKAGYYAWLKPKVRVYDKNNAALKNVSKAFQNTAQKIYEKQIPHQRSRRFNEELEKYLFSLHSYRISFLSAFMYFVGCKSLASMNDKNAPFDVLFPMGAKSTDRMEGLMQSTCYALPNAGKNLRNVEFWGIHSSAMSNITTFWNKACPFRSQCRDMASKVISACKKNPAFYVFFRLILFLTLTGGYYRNARPVVTTMCDWSRYKMVPRHLDVWGRLDPNDKRNFLPRFSEEDSNSDEDDHVKGYFSTLDDEDVYNRMSWENLTTDGRVFNYTVRPTFYTIYLHLIHLFDNEMGEKPLFDFIRNQKLFTQHIWRENLVHEMFKRPFLRETQPHFDMASFERNTDFATNIYRQRSVQMTNVYKVNDKFSPMWFDANRKLAHYVRALEIEHVCANMKKMSTIYAFNKEEFEPKILKDMNVLQDQIIFYEMSIMDMLKQLKGLRRLVEKLKPLHPIKLEHVRLGKSMDCEDNRSTSTLNENKSMLTRYYGENMASDWEKYYIVNVELESGEKESVCIVPTDALSYGDGKTKTFHQKQAFVKKFLVESSNDSCKSPHDQIILEDYRTFPPNWLNTMAFEEAYLRLYASKGDTDKTELLDPNVCDREACMQCFLAYYEDNFLNYILDDATVVDTQVVDKFIEMKETELEEYRKVTVLSDEIKSRIWNLMLDAGHTKENADNLKDLFKHGGLQAYAKLLQLHPYKTKPQSIDNILNSMKLIDFSRLYFLLQCKLVVQSIELQRIDVDTENKIHDALFHYRYRLVEGLETLPESAYDVYITLCCHRIATSSTNGSYGQQRVCYHTTLNTITCGKKTKKNTEVKNLDGTIRGQKADPGFCQAFDSVKWGNVKQNSKIAKSEKRAREKINCRGTPTVRISLKGYRLIHKLPDKERVMYGHCPTCGQFHVINQSLENGIGGYMCESCSYMTMERDRKYFCNHCGIEITKEQRDYSMALPIFDIHSTGDNVVFRASYCRQHTPRAVDSVSNFTLYTLAGKSYYLRENESVKNDYNAETAENANTIGPDRANSRGRGLKRGSGRGRGVKSNDITQSVRGRGRGRGRGGGRGRGRGASDVAAKCILHYYAASTPDIFLDSQLVNLKRRSEISTSNARKNYK